MASRMAAAAASLLLLPLVLALPSGVAQGKTFKVPVGLVPIIGKNIGAFQINVTLGNETVPVSLDTGSAALWGLDSYYKPSDDGTAKKLDKTFALAYGIGSAHGPLYNDTACLGAGCLADFPVGRGIGNSSIGWSTTEIDGIMGFGWGETNEYEAPVSEQTFMQTIMPQLAEPLFTLSWDEESESGQLEFGAVDRSLFDGPLSSVAINETKFPGRKYWAAAGTVGIGVEGESLRNESLAVFDSGTSYILTENATAAAYYAHVPGSKLDQSIGWLLPCDATPPNLDLTFPDNVQSYIDGSAFIGSYQSGTASCFGGVQGSTLPAKFSSLTLIGAPFMRQHVTIWNQGNKTISFARAKTC